jgi:hypothetical protein
MHIEVAAKTDAVDPPVWTTADAMKEASTRAERFPDMDCPLYIPELKEVVWPRVLPRL